MVGNFRICLCAYGNDSIGGENSCNRESIIVRAVSLKWEWMKVIGSGNKGE